MSPQVYRHLNLDVSKTNQRKTISLTDGAGKTGYINVEK